jgi:hypothetical protein
MSLQTMGQQWLWQVFFIFAIRERLILSLHHRDSDSGRNQG